MPTYKVIGRKYIDYYIKVNADNQMDAYEKANGDHIQWFELETDDPIEPIEVILDEENIQLNKDNNEWPSMDMGILIEGNK